MKPELAHFFETMGRMFAEPSRTSDVYAEEPDWPAPLSRVALYPRFVEGHVRSALKKLYPITVAQLGPEQVDALAADYYATRPARHFELNRAGEGFANFLADRIDALELPAHLAALARFEWTDFAVFSAEVDLERPAQGFTANPTLTALTHPWRLCRWIATAPDQRPAAPEPGEETALLWRDPHNLRTTFVAADDRRLLALKLVLEEIPLSTAAARSGVGESTLQAALSDAVSEGLILSSP